MIARIDTPAWSVAFSGVADGDLGRTDKPPSAAGAHARAGVLAACGVAGALVGRQVHGVALTQADGGLRGYHAGEREADGVVVLARGVAAGVHAADCLPIALGGEGGVAMLHGGWRGIAAGIARAGVEALRAAGVHGELSAVIGPGAGGCCYEVGEEVHAALAHLGARRGRCEDLPAAAATALREAGVAAVTALGPCTICAPAGTLFSWRREGAGGGRQGGFAWLR